MNTEMQFNRPYHSRGLTLVELLIATTVSAFLILGATQVYTDCRKAYDTYQTSARLQEVARYALAVIEPDVRMASFWGLVKGGGNISGWANQNAGTAQLGIGSLAAATCGKNFGVDLGTYVQGDNDNYGLACAAYHGLPVASADTLTVRRSSTLVTQIPAATVGPLRVCTTRTSGQLVNVATGCVGAPGGQANDLLIHAYYVDQDSLQAVGVPALRQRTLTQTATPDLADSEIISGVEDMQVQFGLSVSPAPNPPSGVVTQWVDAFGPAALPAAAQIVAVRIWLLVRSDAIETGFKDNNTYVYANRAQANGTTTSLSAAGAAGKVYVPNDNYRRLLVSRTIMLRNSLGT